MNRFVIKATFTKAKEPFGDALERQLRLGFFNDLKPQEFHLLEAIAALKATRRTQSWEELATLTGYSDETVRKAFKSLRYRKLVTIQGPEQ